jgi:hypothetical protein
MITYLINQIKQDKFRYKKIDYYRINDHRNGDEVKNANGDYENIHEIFCRIDSSKPFVSFYIDDKYYDWLQEYEIHMHVFICPSDPFESKLIYKSWVHIPNLPNQIE